MLDAYFAGLFDGEGTMGIYATGNGKDDGVYWSPKLAIHGTYRPMIIAIHEHFGVGQFSAAKRNPGHHLGGKPQWLWQVHSKAKIAFVLKRILPYLMEKKDQAITMLAYCGGELDGETASTLLRQQKRAEFPHSLGEGVRLKRGNPSEECSIARTTWVIAQEIRARVKNGEKQAALCREYGLSKTVVNRIVLNKTYINAPWKANP